MKYPAVMKQTIVSLLLLVMALPVNAQNNLDAFEKYKQDMNKRWDDAKTKQETVFENYRSKVNKEFAYFLEKRWKRVTLNNSVPYPSKPEPEPVFDTTVVEASRPLPYNPPVVVPEPCPQPSPIEPIPSDPVNPEVILVTYLGNTCKVRVPQVKNFSVYSGANSELSNAWSALSGEAYNNMLVDCLSIRKSLGLCDWAFYQFVQSVSKEYCGSDSSAEAVVLQAYILSQLGYKVRLAKHMGKLVPLLAFNDQIYAVPYLTFGRDNFYCFFQNASQGSIQVCDYQFPGEQPLSVKIQAIPYSPELKAEAKVYKSEAYPSVVAKVSANRNLVEFYDKYPSCSWENMAAASLSQAVKDQLYPTLRESIKNLSEQESANVLLNFVQTGFGYKTDEEQFGREKTFFGDELFFYPDCDCEDRSVLFSILVRELLGLKVVLLDYPSHIATAVHFTTPVQGDYFDLNGEKYVVCDPTFIGASIGKTMTSMRGLKANIITIP